jgi:hypothetical protein
MFIRFAYFEGQVDNRDQKLFDNVVVNEMLPLIKSFPEIRDVKVLKNVWVEENAPPIYMCLQLTFDSKEDMEIALQSKQRAASKAKAEEIVPLLNGRVYHMNYISLDI